MRRTILILTAVALMVAVMATSASSAFASNHSKGGGWGVIDYKWKPHGFGQEGNVDWKDEEGCKGYGCK